MRLGTRASALALAQAKQVVELLDAAGRAGPRAGSGEVEIVPILTRGDREAGGARATALAHEDKSRWVFELEAALLRGEIDLAVHSAKDVPGELAEGLALHGVPARAAAADVLCGAGALAELAPGARVATSSIRRAAQLRAAREDIELVAIGGNVDTRLRRLLDPAERLDAIVLARAGLQRLGRDSEVGEALDPERFVPAPGQGALALQGRSDDARAREAASAVTDADSLACLLAERALAHELDASCRTPLGAWATVTDDRRLRMRAWVGLPDGSAWMRDELEGALAQPAALGRELAGRLRAVGAAELLASAVEHRPVGA
jgi:hydroxymethylbilane synthase